MKRVASNWCNSGHSEKATAQPQVEHPATKEEGFSSERRIIEALLLVVSAGLPPVVFENEHLQQLIGEKISAKRATRIATQLKEDVETADRLRMATWKCIVATTDDWSGPDQKQVCGVQVHGIEDGANGPRYRRTCAGHIPVGLERATAANLALKVGERMARCGLAEWEPDKKRYKSMVKWFVTDTWVGNLALVGKFKGAFWLPCWAHVFNLQMKAFLLDKEIGGSIKHALYVAALLRKSSEFRRVLDAGCKYRKIPTATKTRYFSYLHLFTVLLEMRPFLDSYLAAKKPGDLDHLADEEEQRIAVKSSLAGASDDVMAKLADQVAIKSVGDGQEEEAEDGYVGGDVPLRAIVPEAALDAATSPSYARGGTT
jgi:hypothetical protein